MAFQKIFKKDYKEELSNNIRIDDYRGTSFPYDPAQTQVLKGIVQPEGLLEQLDPTPEGDLQTAKAIYEAYKDLTPLMAQQDDLWVYLTHVDLFPYVQKRWSKVFEDDCNKDYIEQHWFKHPKVFLRTTFAGLWWRVYFTIDETRTNKYELTDVLFATGQDFLTMRFGELPLIRHKEAMTGILEFLKDHPELYERNFDPKGQYISRYFNMLGGTKQLSYLDSSFFYNELKKKYDILVSIKTIRDIQNNDINSI